MKLKSKTFYVYTAFVVIYIALTLLPAPDPKTTARYHLSAGAVRLLDFTIIVPLAVIWFAAFYGYQKLHQYSWLIRTTKDGRQVNRLAQGLFVLAIGLPLKSIITASLTLIARHNPSFTATSTIISNYIGVLFPLLAFILISIGARGLSEISKTRPHLWTLNTVALAVIALGVVFCYLIAHAHHDLRTTYHLSYGVVMLTLAIPYMYVWFLGLFAVAELEIYSRKVAGIVYRKSWSLLALGLAAIILVSIILQYLTTLYTWLTALSLPGLLLLLYVLLLLLAASYILVALGTKKLMRIEQV